MRSTTFPRPARGSAPALRLAVAAALLGLAAACGGSAPADGPAGTDRRPVAAAGEIIRPASLKPGQPIPQPTRKPVLSLTGKISAANRGDALVLDQRTLDQLGSVQLRLYDPWAKKVVQYRGVWLQDLLAVAGAGADSTGVHITALDDYQVDLTIADIRAGGIMLATQAGDGSVMPVDKGGPTRIVFMDGVKAGANPDQWIWSLETIDVE
jgi:hypothetical protein